MDPCRDLGDVGPPGSTTSSDFFNTDSIFTSIEMPNKTSNFNKFKNDHLHIPSTDQSPSKSSSQSKESTVTDLPPLPSLQSSNNIRTNGNLSDIIKICDKHVCDQTNSVQSILNICSQITGFSGCEKFCTQIISFCNKILSETYQNTHSIIGICNGLSDLKLEKSVKSSPRKKAKGVSSVQLPKGNVEYSIVKVKDIKTDNGEDKDGAKDEEMSDEDVVDSLNFDSDDYINQEDDPDWSAHWSKKRTITFKKVKKPEEAPPGSDEEAENLSDDAGKDEAQDSDWQPESDTDMRELPKKTPMKPRTKKSVKNKKETPKKNKTHKSSKIETLGEFPCNFCRKICKSKEAHTKHQALHKCDICGLVMLSPGTIYDHKRSHSGEKPFVCDVCGASFSTNPILKKHKINIHTEGRPFPCDQCEYGAKSIELLRRHQLVHSGERKYQCDDCGACFPRSATLKEHVLTHKDIWPHHCQFCPKRFKNIRQLRRHEEIHLDQYKYQCKVCGKRMRQVGNLNTHMRTHNGEKPYVCDKCGKRFAHNVTRKQHMESCFGNPEVLASPPSMLPLPLPMGLQFTGNGLNRGPSTDNRY